MNACLLASAFSEFISSNWMYILAGVLGVIILFYLALRIWLNMTRPVGIKDIPTPTVDRLNMHALDSMAGKTEEEAAAAMQERMEEKVPEDLINAIPPEERRDRPSSAAPDAGGGAK